MIIQEPQNRRERRIAARQAQILEAAADVFSRKGYERATTKEIAIAADVSEGTLYNYFDNKSDLLNGVATAFADGITKDIDAIEAKNLDDMMAQLLTARFRSGRERRLFMLFIYESRLSPEIHREYVQRALNQIIQSTENRFREFMDSGVMRQLDPAVAARAINATIMGFAALFEMGQYGGRNNGFSPDKWGVELTDLFLKGLQHPDGAEEDLG